MCRKKKWEKGGAGKDNKLVRWEMESGEKKGGDKRGRREGGKKRGGGGEKGNEAEETV